MTAASAVVRPARADEAAAVSDLALRSKSYWGYSREFLEACREELTYSASDCASGDLFIAEVGDETAGFFLLRNEETAGELSALFVDPAFIGTGVGGRLLRRALDLAAERGWHTMTLDADPGAEGFYARYGARRIADVASGSIPGRVLPRMQFTVRVGTQVRPDADVPR